MIRSTYSDPTEEEFHRLVYSIWDFQQALSALTFLIEECELDRNYCKIELRRCKCYENQAVMSFCRPFVATRSGIQLSLSKLGIKLTEDETILKEELLNFRNKLIAHSDEEEMHYRGVTVEVSEDVPDMIPAFIFDEGIALSEFQRTLLEQLLRKLIQYIYRHLAKLCRQNPTRFDTYKLPKSSNNH